MTDRGKLIELIGQVQYLGGLELALADHLIANGVTFARDNNVGDKWIPVTERLPENICPVLVAVEGLNTAFHGWYQDGKWWKVGAGSRPFTQKVTHWMPLPVPPKGE
jgi:hypothetical protein